MTHNPAEALRPCPFCGGEAEIERRGDHRVSTVYSCSDCGCRLETGEEWGHGTQWNERAALTSPAPAGGELVATMTKALPGGQVDDATYEQIEGALDRLEAPCRSPDGRWLKLHERIAMLAAVTPPPSPDVAGVVEYLRKAAAFLPFSDLKSDLTLAERARLLEAATLLTTLSAERERLERERDEFRDLHMEACCPIPISSETKDIVDAVCQWVNARGGDETADQIAAMAVQATLRALTPKDKS